MISLGAWPVSILNEPSISVWLTSCNMCNCFFFSRRRIAYHYIRKKTCAVVHSRQVVLLSIINYSMPPLLIDGGLGRSNISRNECFLFWRTRNECFFCSGEREMNVCAKRWLWFCGRLLLFDQGPSAFDILVQDKRSQQWASRGRSTHKTEQTVSQKKKEQTAWAGYDYTNQTVRNPVTAQQIKSEPNIVSGYIL
jgi:hypothetical protein